MSCVGQIIDRCSCILPNIRGQSLNTCALNLQVKRTLHMIGSIMLVAVVTTMRSDVTKTVCCVEKVVEMYFSNVLLGL